MPKHSELVRDYFQSKSKQLLAASDEAVCDHNGLKGSHREEVIRIYLRDILPARFGVGHGMVYGPDERSQEADIVIWDAQSYPRLQMHGHSLFFAESARATIEVKTRWTDAKWQEVRSNTEAVRRIQISQGRNLNSELALLNLKVDLLGKPRVNTVANHQIYETKHRIGTNAIFLHGGDSLLNDDIPHAVLDQIDVTWPDSVLLLERGVLVVKEANAHDRKGWLRFLELPDDALLAFTNQLHAQVIERSVYVEDPLYLWKYVGDDVPLVPKREIPYPLVYHQAATTFSWDED